MEILKLSTSTSNYLSKCTFHHCRRHAALRHSREKTLIYKTTASQQQQSTRASSTQENEEKEIFVSSLQMISKVLPLSVLKLRGGSEKRESEYKLSVSLRRLHMCPL